MTEFIIKFPGDFIADIETVGGKGRNLSVLAKAQFPVPPGFIITADAYSLWVAECLWLKQEIASLRDYSGSTSSSQDGITAMLEKKCQSIIERLILEPLPAVIADSIKQTLSSWSDTEVYAVRSSSTFEDLADAAFAGQHDTFLNCNGLESILTAVKKCWASLWSSRAVLYRESLGYEHEKVTMAVVVQQQIHCEVAGVAFSLHPVTGSPKTICIDSNFGLGESVVSGNAPVDHFEVKKKTYEIESSSIAHKTEMIVSLKDGTETKEVPESLRDASSLSQEMLKKVCALSEMSEQYFGWPQDIEWGIKHEVLYLLQSRAVTRIPARWTRDESAERFPMPSTPLSWEYMFKAFQRSLKFSLPRLGLPAFDGEWFQRKGWYIYGNQNAVEIVSQYIPIQAHTFAELVPQLEAIRKRYEWVVDFSAHWMNNLDTYLIRLGEMNSVDLKRLTEQELLAHFETLVEITSEYFEPNIAISMGQGFLHKTLFQLCCMAAGRENAPRLFDGLLAGVETKTCEVNTQLFHLAMALKKYPSLLRILSKNSNEESFKKGVLGPFPEWRSLFEKFLKAHGHRELYQDYYYPTWGEAPWVVLDLVVLLAKDDLSTNPMLKSREGRKHFYETERSIEKLIPEDIRYFFKEVVRMARSFTLLDDLEHYQTTRVNPLARRAALALGEKLTARGFLEMPHHVFFLHERELNEVVSGSSMLTKEILSTRAADFERESHTEPSWIFGETTHISINKDAMRGIPGSPGSISAPCYLVSSTADFSKFPKGAILVSKTTNPAWTPLFHLASGVVTESGGPLSHGAVTAREIGIPAVMGVQGVMSVLKTGDVISIDGNQGVVSKGSVA